MTSTIQVRVDDALRKKSDDLFRDLGTDTTSAIRMFLVQAIANNGFPFEIKKCNPFTAMTEGELLMKLEKSRENANNGKVRDADDVIHDMRTRYGI